MAKKFCNHAGCRALVALNVKYCEKHQKQANSDTYHHRRYEQGRDQFEAFYRTSAWKKMSRQMLIRSPICKLCYQEGVIRKADIVDHITPIREDWSRRLDWDNMQTLCIYHHNQKTNIENQRRIKK
ncbi:HNH endonuclease [Pediococcus claussenii]|uniref:Putative HNH nuclease YajD n=1 Tax=Pediococcus claussenii (strain ATCC BAA-344 / DSM 14800 / JCM 18046 / KCTC 3811 / LMG 21948 / P06) TaxID=701521 RepID=G8PCA8_PEDCP|nr:HNH endonuclease [Pediococcus claussenii]AEV94893.1 HNH endonuclease family protein, phage-related protein [Pediococcus claussenii ATCC BAA-344]ANZ70089.1 endonuclease [Pediococcus claussenii]ANZ71904.1 endonuclease [Pediococcus claussenii]